MNKQIIFTLLVVGSMIMTSCTDNGKKATTSAAKTVTSTSQSGSTAYKNVTNGFINWKASHLGGVQPRFGKIFIKDAICSVSNNAVTNAKFTIDLSTLTVESFPEGAEEIAKLKGHLLSPDFFNAAKYPTATFELTGIQKTSGKYNSKVTGNLTILDKTKSITFDANVSTANNQVSVKSEDFSIDRRDWGLTYNVEGTAGVPVDYIVSNDVGFTINVTVGK